MDLFDRLKKPASESSGAEERADAAVPVAPLAERMRPQTLEDLVGHEARVGPETPLGRSILADRSPSLILWGPPGCGKTTVARVIATYSRARFVSLSAVLAGVADVRNTIAQAEAERRAGRRTLMFIDEIHRFNKAQQDALLPHVEAGTVTLLGATTENPSFALTAALLSRCQVVRLEPLPPEALTRVLRRAVTDRDRGLGSSGVSIEDVALEDIASWSDGDARRALGLLEHVVQEAEGRNASQVTARDVAESARERTLRYDREGEEHYNVVSAFIKSMRGSDPDAALYWCVRMIEAGEDPLFVLRRMMIFAAEDVGMADPRALETVAAADHAFQRVGLPEGLIPIAFAVTYLAVAPKSKAAYRSLRAVQEEIARSGTLPVPMRLRNAPTKAMASWGYGRGYNDPQSAQEGFVAERYLPDALGDRTFYSPTSRGFEGRVAEHLTRLREAAHEAMATAATPRDTQDEIPAATDPTPTKPTSRGRRR